MYNRRLRAFSLEVSTPAPTIVEDDSFEKELCRGKEAGEWFRLQAGDGDNCRDVIQCTSAVSRVDSGARESTMLMWNVC